MEPIQQIKALQITEDDKANLQHLTQECGVTEQALNQGMTYIKMKRFIQELLFYLLYLVNV